MTGKLIIFSAPSGSGKSTIINYLLTQNLNLRRKNFANALRTTNFWSMRRCIRTVITER